MTFGVAAYRYNGINKVIFNNPATIVLWNDGTKTVVKRQKGERWDKEKGLAMAIVKHVCGHDKGTIMIFSRNGVRRKNNG